MGNRITLTYRYEEYVHSVCIYTDHDVKSHMNEKAQLFKQGSYNCLETAKQFILKKNLDPAVEKSILSKIENNQTQLNDAYKKGTQNAVEVMLREIATKNLRERILLLDPTMFTERNLFSLRGIEGAWEYTDDQEKRILWSYIVKLFRLAEEIVQDVELKCEYNIYTHEEYDEQENNKQNKTQ